MRFHFKEVNHVPRKGLYIADALSRMQADNPNTQATVPEEEMNIYVDSTLDSLPVSDVKLIEIKESQDEDPVCKQIKLYCMEGCKFHLHDAIKPYWAVKEEPSVVHGVLLKASRIVRLQVLDKMHEGHEDMVKSKEHAKTSVLWSSLSHDS